MGLIMKRTIRFAVLALALATAFGQGKKADKIVPINPAKLLDVCAVLQNLQEYRGKIIAIRGRWDGSDIRELVRSQRT